MVVREVQTAKSPLCGQFTAPASKSVTHRALVAAALADGTSVLEAPLDSDDTRATLAGIGALGFETRIDGSDWVVRGRRGEVPGGGDLWLRESGTSFRFLTALAALGRAPSRLDGAARLRERPVTELSRALVQLGAAIETAPGGGLPLTAGGRPPRGGAVAVTAARSSQFVSALLLVGGRLPQGLRLRVDGRAVSRPYVDVTLAVLREFGVTIGAEGEGGFRIDPVDYGGRRFRVGGDHSSASYLLAAAAVTGGRVRVDRLDPASPQPDARFCRILERLGCRVRAGEDRIEVTGGTVLPAFDLDLADSPDLGPTLAVLALFADGACRLRGAAHLRLKESDRLEVLARNLRALGREAVAGPDSLEVGPPPRAGLHGATIETASDHRMAMAFAIAGLRLPGVVIDDAGCVEKSWPGFWEVFAELEGQ
jgi:3-phosphoshikimate 1-carboxyvinyltransferase